MNDYLLLIALIITGCSLSGVLLIYLHCRRLKKRYNGYLIKYIRECDRLIMELEHTRIEKDTMEKLFKTYFSKAAGSLDAESRTVTTATDSEINVS